MINISDVSFAIIAVGRIMVVIVFGLLALRFGSKVFGRFTKTLSSQAQMLLNKTFVYLVWVMMFFCIVQELGFNISALLGAAGVAGVAIGFASQTSISNIISGLFIISEQPFQVDDIIRVGDIEGFVVEVDLMSIKIRMYNNSYVRIPHESIIKSSVQNLTRFPVRRYDFVVGVAYKEDLRKVVAVLTDVINKNQYAVKDKEPSIVVNTFADSEIQITVGVWVNKADWNALRKIILVEIKERFEKEGIEIPFPQRVVHTQKESK